jgi:hypothetical protein
MAGQLPGVERTWLCVYKFSKFGLEMVHWDLGRQCKEAQKEEQQSIMVSLGVSHVHFNAIRGCGSLVGDSLLTKNGPGWMTTSPLISIERTKLRVAY